MRRRLSHNLRVAVGLVFLLLAQLVVGQNNPALTNNDPINSNINANTFYFDSNSDCNGPIRELYGLEATIRGNDLSSQRLGPATCTIVLRSTSQFEGTVLDIEVKAMNILDCTTQVAIYDGDGAQILLMSHDCRSSQNQFQKRFLTSGNTATFIMTRPNVNSYNFDIEIKIYPVRAGSDTNYENGYGSSNPFAFYKFPHEGIVGMIGGFYAAIIGICIIVIIYKNRSFQGLNKEWETHQLATLKTEEVCLGCQHTTEPKTTEETVLEDQLHILTLPTDNDGYLMTAEARQDLVSQIQSGLVPQLDARDNTTVQARQDLVSQTQSGLVPQLDARDNMTVRARQDLVSQTQSGLVPKIEAGNNTTTEIHRRQSVQISNQAPTNQANENHYDMIEDELNDFANNSNFCGAIHQELLYDTLSEHVPPYQTSHSTNYDDLNSDIVNTIYDDTSLYNTPDNNT
ncbi:uncharacterized protein LOC131927886 isoform X1 [Physella acuta]|uniref:uncharacterized protein LOC131927886 isoform X1 n=1 Tax=Physella acuta TaxID=109671 RepID=UPI0027DCD991|nr:uncharacterized protein LOC131927886 isoform X1 [Physella acuta]